MLGITAVRSASAKFSDAAGWVIQLTFTSDGSEQFAAITTKYLDKRLAILINGKIRCAPVVRGVIKESVEISGDFTADKATSLAADLNAAVAKATDATPSTP